MDVGQIGSLWAALPEAERAPWLWRAAGLLLAVTGLLMVLRAGSGGAATLAEFVSGAS